MQPDSSSAFTDGSSPAAPMVLAAEDIAVNQFLLQAFLDDLGVCYEIVDDGEAAVSRFKAARFDLVLMDIRMPKMDGFTALREIRALGESGQSVPIVAMTANATASERAELEGAGFDSILGKPFTLDDLRQGLAAFQIG